MTRLERCNPQSGRIRFGFLSTFLFIGYFLFGQDARVIHTLYYPDSIYIKQSQYKQDNGISGDISTIQEENISNWMISLLPGKNSIGVSTVEHYDYGYITIIRGGPTYPPINYLTKTDINGIVLWAKTLIVDGIIGLSPIKMERSQDGSLFITGGIDNGLVKADSYLMKLNVCGEMEWIKRFDIPNYDYGIGLTADPDGGCTLLNYYDNDYSGMINRLTLLHFDSQGDLVWQNRLLNDDTLGEGSIIWSTNRTQDSGYLLSGMIYYASSINPSYHYYHPYIIKANENGELIWQKIINKSNDNGGMAKVCIVDTALSTIYALGPKNTVINWPGGYIMNPCLYKLNSAGDTLLTQRIIKDTLGCCYDAVWVDSSLIITTIDLDMGGPWWYQFIMKTDTLGNLIKLRQVIDDLYPMYLTKTFDGKIICMAITSTVTQPVDFNTYLYKFNQNLEFDTVYTQPFVYDYLCPYPIGNDTVWCDNYDILGSEELEPEALKKLLVYPNPSVGVVNVRLRAYEITELQGEVFNSTLVSYKHPIKKGILEVYDIFGKKVAGFQAPAGQEEVQIEISNFPSGLYLLRYVVDNELKGSGKLVIGTL